MNHLIPPIIAALLAATGFANSEIAHSPDGRTAIRIESDASRFSITRGDEIVIESSPLGLELDGAPDLAVLALERREDVAVDRTIDLIASKAATAPSSPHATFSHCVCHRQAVPR